MTPYLKPGLMDIDEIIAGVFGTSKSEMISRNRKRHIADARKFAMWYRVSRMGETLVFAANQYKRDHATAVWARNETNSLMETDKSFREKAEYALRKLEKINQ